MLRNALTALFCAVLVLVAGCSLIEDTDPPGPAPTATAIVQTGTIIINTETEPPDQAGAFTYTGVPSGTVSVDNSLIVSDLEPGTYTTTQVDPAPDFDVTAVRCDDADSASVSTGDPGSRTAVINLENGETVTCAFTNTQRATAVVVSESEPEGAGGEVRFTGVPTGTIPVDGGTLVTAELPPGTYTSTQVDPAPLFDLTAVRCDDGDSGSASSGDPVTRSAILNLDAGEMVTCVFTNTRRGAAVVAVDADAAVDAELLFTGVPSGTVSTRGTLMVTDLTPGTYTTTLSDPSPEFEILGVRCDDDGAGMASIGDASTRSTVFNIDPGETVTCTYELEYQAELVEGGEAGGGRPASEDDPSTAPVDGGINPFADPDPDFENFPLPDDLPADAGTVVVPRPGPWTSQNLTGRMDCGGFVLDIPPGPAEAGELEVLDNGAVVVGNGVSGETPSVTLEADQEIAGRYAGRFDATEQGVPIVIDYYWQVVTSEYIVGYLTSTFTSEGVTCTLYRPFDLRYTG